MNSTELPEHQPLLTRSRQRVTQDDRLSRSESWLITTALTCLLGTILLTTTPALAADYEPTAATPLQWSVVLDNDLYAAGPDRDYTAGLRITTWRTEDRSTQFGLLMYTPDNLSNTTAQAQDRPYANLLYAGRSTWQTRDDGSALTRRTLTVGLLGSPLGAGVQRFVHKSFGSERPRGVRRQISDGGELTGRAGWTQYAPIYLGKLQRGLHPSAATQGRSRYLAVVRESAVSVGYLTEASIGVGVRLTRTPRWWGENTDDFVTQLDEPERTNGIAGARGSYWFAGVRLKARAYNALLQGQFRDSEVTLSRSQLQPLVGQAWVGVATAWRGLQVKYALRYQTAERKRAHGGRSQYYGSITLARATR